MEDFKTNENISFLSQFKKKIKTYCKEKPKEAFMIMFGLLALSVIISITQLYFITTAEKTSIQYGNNQNDIGDILQQKENRGGKRNLMGVGSVGNPIELYGKMQEVEAINRRIKEIRSKPNKTANDSIELINIYKKLKTLSHE